MKKLFSIIMSVLMIACFMPAAAFAAAKENCTGTCTHQAAIGTTHYDTLAEAITAAAADNIITLLSDVTVDSTIIAIPEDKTVVIDLNGKDISSSTGCTIVNKGNLTISGSGNVSTTAGDSAAIANFPGAVANVNGGTYVSSNWYVIKNMGEMTINGAVEVKKPENSVNTSSLIDNGWASSKGDTVAGGTVAPQANKAKLTIKNGEFSGKAGLNSCSVVKNDDYGELTISGGTFDSTNNTGQNNATTILNWNKATISGGTFKGQYPISNGAYTGESDKGELTITGGTFTGVERIFGKGEGGDGKGTVTVTGGSFTAPEIGGNYAEENGGYTLSITGGTFTSDPSAYLADNRIVRFENGKYEVEPFDTGKAGITLAPLVDKSAYPITDLEEDYEMIWDGENVAINFKPQLHTNGAATLGKWVGIAVPVPEGAKTVDYKYSDKDLVKGVSLEGEVWENASGKKFISFYWDYATRFVTSLSYKFDNVGNTNTVDITVNGYPTEIIKAPLHDASGSIADNNLCSKYEIDHEAGAAIITVKGLKAHANASGDKGKWVGIAVPADYKTTDTELIYRYKDGDKGTWGSWKTAELKSEVWEKDGKKYVSFYMDSEKVSVRWIDYSFGTLTAEDANKDGVEVAGVNTVQVEVKVENVSSGGGNSSSKATTTDSVTNDAGDKTGSTTASTTATVKSETKTNADGTKTTTATVDTTTAADIVKKTVENKSEEVVVNMATTTAQAVTETAAGTKTEVALPEQTVKSIANETEAAVTIKSDAAEVKLDKEAVKAVAEQAGDTGTVSLVVETVAQSETKVEVDLKLVTSKGNVTEFKGGSVSVTVKLNAALAAKPVVCVYIDNFGTYHKVSGQKNADGTYTFVTGHFSSYAVMAEDDADKVIAEQTENVEKLVGGLTLKARSQKTEKGSIKVTLNADEDAIKQIEDLGYTVKYKFYRSTKKAKGYKAKYEKAGETYTNTAGTRGTRYYYKARVMVYDAQGALVAKTALTQCKYACRIWK